MSLLTIIQYCLIHFLTKSSQLLIDLICINNNLIHYHLLILFYLF